MSSRVIAQLLALFLAAGMVQSRRVKRSKSERVDDEGSSGSLEVSVENTTFAGAGIKICKALNGKRVSHGIFSLKVECQQDGKKGLGLEAQYAYKITITKLKADKTTFTVIFEPSSHRPHIHYAAQGGPRGHVQYATELNLFLGSPTSDVATLWSHLPDDEQRSEFMTRAEEEIQSTLAELMDVPKPEEGREFCLIAPVEKELKANSPLNPLRFIGNVSHDVTGYKTNVLKLAVCTPLKDMSSGHVIPKMKDLNLGSSRKPRWTSVPDADHVVSFSESE